MQADVELVCVVVSFAEEALQGAHLVLMEGLVQVAADQAHCTGLDHLPAGNGLQLHAGLGLRVGQHYHGAAMLVVGLWEGWGQGWQGVMQVPGQGIAQGSGLRVIPAECCTVGNVWTDKAVKSDTMHMAHAAFPHALP